jgi:hypothetical protein
MPYYRSRNEEEIRKPKKRYYKEDECDWEEEEEDDRDDRKCPKPPCICKFECPFKVIVKLVPCDDRKRPM